AAAPRGGRRGAQLREPLRERRGRPLPRRAEDGRQGRRHARDHPGDRRRSAMSQDLTNQEILRYSRHLIMPEVTIDGQRRLKAGSVLLIGAGGLGSPSALYLAAAGVGRIGIVDADVVDETNLQRQ